MVAHTTYANNLISKGHGYPLWEPDPGNYAPIELADVGYLYDGAFIKLFNASTNQYNRSNRLGFPNDHIPIDVGDVLNKTPLPKRPKYISSEGVSEADANMSATAGLDICLSSSFSTFHLSNAYRTSMQARGGFTLASSHQQGAVLTMGDVAYRQDALDEGKFLEYFIQHHRSWLTFANTLGRGLALTDILFVTGCDKTSDWACAAWSEKTSSITLSFIANVAGVAQGNATVWGRWESSQSLDENLGPQRLIPPSEVMSINDPMSINESMDPSIDVAARPMTPHNSSQCVFVRGFRMGDRSSWFRRKTVIDVGDGFMTVRKPLEFKTNQPPKLHGHYQQQLSTTMSEESVQGSESPQAIVHRSGDDNQSPDSDEGMEKANIILFV